MCKEIAEFVESFQQLSPRALQVISQQVYARLEAHFLEKGEIGKGDVAMILAETIDYISTEIAQEG